MKERMKRALALLLALLVLAGCAPEAEEAEPIEIESLDQSEAIVPGMEADLEAASMRLRRTEGGVSVTDGDGKMVRPRDDLGLYSDYQVATRRESFAWIDLDRVKLTKLDQESEIAIEQEDRHLEIQVQKGSLFFNITEPLEADETLNIRASTMLVGIRGTCGWVEVPSGGEMYIYLLEGTAALSVTDAQGVESTAEVHGGEVAHLTVDRQDRDAIVLDTFAAGQVPPFALDEVREDAALCEKIQAESGLDLYQFDLGDAARAALESVSYFGDADACAISGEQAAAFAKVLEARMREAEDAFQVPAGFDSGQLRCVAALADAGGGVPILLYGCYAEVVSAGYTMQWDIATAAQGVEPFAIWQWQDGAAVLWEQMDNTQVSTVSVYPGYLALGAFYGGFPPDITDWVYPMSGGALAEAASTWTRAEGVPSGPDTYTYNYTLDGAASTMEAHEAWLSQWDPGSTLYYGGGDRSFSSGDPGVTFKGFSPAEDVLEALRGGAAASAGLGDPQALVRNTPVETGVENMACFSEIPVLPETSDAYRAINETLQASEDAFLAQAQGSFAVGRQVRTAENADVPFEVSRSAQVTCPTDRLLCVELFSYYYTYEPHPHYNTECFNFDLETGRLLALSDVADASAAEIQAYILAELERRNGESGEIWLDSFRNHYDPAVTALTYTAETWRGYNFTVQDGAISVVFAVEEAAPYAAGVPEPIVLPYAVRAELQ